MRDLAVIESKTYREYFHLLPGLTLRDFYHIIFRHRRKVAGFFLTSMLFTFLFTFLSPKIYKSDATLMLRLGRESVSLDPTVTAPGQTISVGQSRENEIRSELEILKSRSLAEKIVDAIGYETLLGIDSPMARSSSNESQGSSEITAQSLRDRDLAIEQFMKSLDVNNQRNSNVISVSYEAGSPGLAHKVLANFIDFYLDKHISVHESPGTLDFFTQQVQLSHSKLADAERRLSDLKNETGISSFEENRKNLLTRNAELRREMTSIEASLAGSKSKVAVLESTIAGLPANLIRTKLASYSGNPVDYLQQRLHDLQLKEQDLLSKFTEKNEMVKEIRRQIGETESILKKYGSSKSEVVRAVLMDEKSTISDLNSKSKVLLKDLAESQKKLIAFNNQEIKFSELQRQIDNLRAAHRTYSDKLEQANINKALDLERISNISIVQAATLPVKPVRPQVALYLTLGTIFSLCVGIGMALLADRMDHSLKTMDEVETRLKLPIIGSIPILNLEPKKESTLLIADYGSSFQIQKDFEEEQPFQEWNLGYDNLKDNLLLSIDGCPNPPCILGVTSCYPGEGVSTIAANLAQSLIKEGNGRVLLVDANLRHPSNHLIFDLALSPGLSDILFKEHENLPVIHTLPKQGLDVLTSGNREVQSLHLAESKAFNDFLERCKKDYSFVIIDMPPISEGSSAIRLASITDGVIFVVEFERVRRQVALRAKELLVKAQTNLLGVVLNKRKFYVPEWLYRTL